MKRNALLFCASACALGAKPNDVTVFLLVWGPILAVFVALGLPLGIALTAQLPSFAASSTRAATRRVTACALVGAGIVFAVVFAVAALGPRAPLAALFVLCAAVVLFLAGFTGCSRRFGERMLGTASSDPSLRPLVLGWLARAGLFAVPVAGPFVGMWLVVVATGVPVVALFDRAETPPST